jgi:CIC family chloride channel protein
VLEVSGNYEIIVPVIVANTFSYVVSRSLQTIPIFDLLTRQDGLILPSLEEEREEVILHVEDAMLPAPVVILNAQDYVDANARRVQDSAEPAFLVRMHPSGWNLVTREQLQRMDREGKGELTLASVLPKQSLPSLYPDLPLDSALRYVNDYALVPVVNRANSHKLEGVVSRDSVFQKYGSGRVVDVPSVD